MNVPPIPDATMGSMITSTSLETGGELLPGAVGDERIHALTGQGKTTGTGGHGSVRAVAPAGTGVRTVFGSMISSLERMESRLDVLSSRLARGRELSPQELVHLQELVLAHARMTELLARVVEVVKHDLDALQRSVR